MFVHKYISGGDTIYRVTQESSKPGSLTLKQTDWIGKVIGKGKAETAVNILEKQFRQPAQEDTEDKKASVANVIRNFISLAGDNS